MRKQAWHLIETIFKLMDSPQAWTTYLFQVGEVWTLEDSILTPDTIRSIVSAISTSAQCCSRVPCKLLQHKGSLLLLAKLATKWSWCCIVSMYTVCTLKKTCLYTEDLSTVKRGRSSSLPKASLVICFEALAEPQCCICVLSHPEPQCRFVNIYIYIYKI